jgi:hypothetical protein
MLGYDIIFLIVISLSKWFATWEYNEIMKSLVFKNVFNMALAPTPSYF